MIATGDRVCARVGSMLAVIHGRGSGTVVRTFHLRDSARIDVLWDEPGPPGLGLVGAALEPIGLAPR